MKTNIIDYGSLYLMRMVEELYSSIFNFNLQATRISRIIEVCITSLDNETVLHFQDYIVLQKASNYKELFIRRTLNYDKIFWEKILQRETFYKKYTLW